MSGSKYEQRVARLRRDQAERVAPLKLGPSERADKVSPAERVAVLETLRHQLLFGASPEASPFPSRALHPRAAALFRARALGLPAFAQLEQQISSDSSAGPRLFGADWQHVACVFDLGPAPKRKRAPLEQVDLQQWRREQWASFLASDEGKAAVESGRLLPAPERGVDPASSRG
jgi:hypothetical protein